MGPSLRPTIFAETVPPGGTVLISLDEHRKYSFFAEIKLV
jgi:hypothetical protein